MTLNQSVTYSLIKVASLGIIIYKMSTWYYTVTIKKYFELKVKDTSHTIHKHS